MTQRREETIKPTEFTSSETYFTYGLCIDCLLSEFTTGNISTSAAKWTDVSLPDNH